MSATPAPTRRVGGALSVGAGILASRLFGLVRQRATGHFLGVGDAADALSAAMRIPNLLQNLLGEGVLSASFVPVYARLRASGREQDAAQLARLTFTALAATSAVVVAVGVVAAPWLVTFVAGGFAPGKQEFTVGLVRILFPGMALLVFSAWCLGVLIAHRRYLLSYTAPVAWNVAIIGTLVVAGPGSDPDGAARLVAIAAVGGSVLQFGVQLPSVLRLLGSSRGASGAGPEFRLVVSNFVPVVAGRGVVQLSGWIDTLIASFVVPGAAATLMYAQNIALLPVSVFGMSISASELTEMAARRPDEVEATIRDRLVPALRSVAFFVVPSAVALAALGDVIAGAILESGRFSEAETRWVWGVLAGASVGLVAGTMGRLYNAAWYALHDTRTPVRYAFVRVIAAAVLGGSAALWGPAALGLPAKWGVAGITAGAGIGAWIEFALLRRALMARIGSVSLPPGLLARLWGAAVGGAAAGYATKLALAAASPVVVAATALPVMGLVYVASARALGVAEVDSFLARLRSRARRADGAG